MVIRFAPLCSILFLSLSAPACSGSSPVNDAFSAFGEPGDAPPPIREAAKAVVRIRTAGSSATGAFLSKDGMLLTNNHVLGAEVCALDGCYASLSFERQWGAELKPPVTVFARPLHVDVGLDMAVVQVFSVDDSGQPTDKLEVSHSLTLKPRDAESLLQKHVHVVGHPHGFLKKWTSGDVADFDGFWFRSTAAALPGNSGSPVLDDDGNIVGLLHRAPQGEDLITQNGANLYSIATTSAALEVALGEALPTTVRSIAVATADEVVEREKLYLNAHAATVMVGGEQKDVLSILGDACDRGLARDDYTSLEDLFDGLSGCSAAMRWIMCTEAATVKNWGVCPDEAGRAAWRERYQRLFDQMLAFNGDLWLDAASFALKELESAEGPGNEVGRQGLLQALESARPPLDLSLAFYLAAFDVKTYDGKETLDYLLAYEAVPHYELSVIEIVYTALWLNYAGALDESELSSMLARLADDEKISLGGKLLIEDVQYGIEAR